MPINDKYIIDIAKGNVDSFKRFYTVLFPVLSVYAYRLVRNETEARDIVQESMIIYWENGYSLTTWILPRLFYSVTRNRCLNLIRDREIEGRYFSYSQYFSERKTENNLIIENEVHAQLHRAIEMLPAQTRKIIKMSMSGMKNQTIADSLEISVNTVKTLKKAGYRYLKKMVPRIMLFLFSCLIHPF